MHEGLEIGGPPPTNETSNLGAKDGRSVSAPGRLTSGNVDTGKTRDVLSGAVLPSTLVRSRGVNPAFEAPPLAPARPATPDRQKSPRKAAVEVDLQREFTKPTLKPTRTHQFRLEPSP